MASHATSASSLATALTDDCEKELLLGSDVSDSPSLEPSRKKRLCRKTTVFVLIGVLVAFDVLFGIAAAVFAFQLRARDGVNASWAPPEHYRTQIFQYEAAYGGEPNVESEKAWTELIPKGKGYVYVQNEIKLPAMPGLDQTLPQQRAMISVFHQLHCLYITRQSFFNVKAGNLDEVRTEHLSHCWDYLRQTVMCAGDTTMEWVPAPPNNVGSTGWGYQHVCKDYSAIFRWAEQNRVTDLKQIHS